VEHRVRWVLGHQQARGSRAALFCRRWPIKAVAKTIARLQDKCNTTIGAAIHWLEKAWLTIAANKTGAVLLLGRKKVENMIVSVNGTQVSSQESLKYLGVMIVYNINLFEVICV